jgi:hypothetical protein
VVVGTLALLAVAASVVLWVLVSVGVDRPVTYASITDHFKYGSIGSEPGGSLLRPVGGTLPPYWVLRALPRSAAIVSRAGMRHWASSPNRTGRSLSGSRGDAARASTM